MFDESEEIKLHADMYNGLMGLLKYYNMPTNSFQIGLDVGGGYGVSSIFLTKSCEHVYISDLIDYNCFDGKENLINLLAEKAGRHNLAFDRSRVELHKCDAQNLIYKDKLFDFIYSINALEHIPDPRLAWAEIARVSKAGAVVAVQFDPIWTSAFGHHLFDLPLDPWDHLILDEDDFLRKVIEVGGSSTHLEVYKDKMNRRSFSYQADAIVEAGEKYFEEFHFDYWDRSLDSALAAHPNLKLAVKKGFEADHLIVRGFNFVGRISGEELK